MLDGKESDGLKRREGKEQPGRKEKKKNLERKERKEGGKKISFVRHRVE